MPRHRSTYLHWLTAALGLVALAALWSGGRPAADGAWAAPFLRGYIVAWACYAAAGTLVNRTGRTVRWLIVWIVLAGVAMRVVYLVHLPPLSTDIHRYLWDGRVANAGINPFRCPPDADELRALRNDDWSSINFRHIPTIYPPAAQMLFAALARARSSDPQAFRWAFALFDVGSILVLIALLRRTDRPPARVIWYAWCPLAVTELTAGGHADAFGLFLLLLAFLFAGRAGGRPGPAAAAALAASVMTKGYALLTIPFFIKRGGVRFAVVFALASLALLLPYLGAGVRLFGGLRAYMSAWEANSSIFLLLDNLLEPITAIHFGVARFVTIAGVIAVIAWLTWRQRPGLEWLLGAAFAAFGAQLLLGAPTLPWYVVWVVPALCWWSVPALALFTLTVSAQYYARWLDDGGPAFPYALLWAGYLPVYALLIGQAVWRRLGRHRSDSSRTP